MSINNMNTNSNRSKKSKSIVTRVLSFRKSKKNIMKETGDQNSSSSRITKDDASSNIRRRLFKIKDRRQHGTFQATKKRAKGSVMDTYQAVVDKCVLLRSSSSCSTRLDDKSISSSQRHSKPEEIIQDLKHQIQVLKFDNKDLRRRLQDTRDQLSTVSKEKDLLENELLHTQVFAQAEVLVIPEAAYEIIDEDDEHLMDTSRYQEPPDAVALPITEEDGQRPQEVYFNTCELEMSQVDCDEKECVRGLTEGEEEEQPQLIFLNHASSLSRKDDILVATRSHPSDHPGLVLDESHVVSSTQHTNSAPLPEAFVVQILLDDEGSTSNAKPECNEDHEEISQQQGGNLL